MIAVSDDGQRLLFADATSALHLLKPNSDPELLSPMVDVSAVEFVPDRHDAIICDRRLANMLLLAEATAGVAMRVIASRRDGVNDPGLAIVSNDGATALIADGEHAQVWTIRLDSGSIRQFNTLGPALLLLRSRTPNTFLISSVDTVWIMSCSDDVASSIIPGSARPLQGGR
jgi:hypothetical protein